MRSVKQWRPRLFGATLAAALLLLAGSARAQIESGDEGGEGGEAGAELQRGAYTQEQYESEAFNAEVDALQFKKSEARQRKIATLEDILRKNPYHPEKADLFFRLAEAYWEENKYQYLRARREYDKQLDAFEGGTLQVKPVEPQEDYSVSLEYYRKIIQQYPNYGRIDEVIYYLGRGALQMGKGKGDRELQKQGVQYFQKLVQNYPNSRYIADAYLALGEYYFENNSLYYAKVNYEKIINNYKSATMYNYALYKLGWVYFNLREFEKAIETFQNVVEMISGQTAIEFRAQALNDLVVTYAEVDNGWQRAREYFISVVGEEEAYGKLRKLADLYVGQDKDQEAIELYSHLIEHEATSHRVPHYFSQVIEVYKKINDPTNIEDRMNEAVEYLRLTGPWWAANQKNQEALDEARDLGENSLLYLANQYHLKAQKESRPELYTKAADYYQKFLKYYPDSEKAYIVNFWYAEILANEVKDFARAAEQYAEVIKKDKKGKYVADAARAIIDCYYDLMVQAGLRPARTDGKKAAGSTVKREKLSAAEVKKREEHVKRTELHELEKKYTEAADHYVDLITALKNDAEAWKKVQADKEAKERMEAAVNDIPAMMYVAAEVFYEHGQIEEALVRLRKIFEYDPKHEFAGWAVGYLLDGYRRLRHWDKVEEWARKLIAARNFGVYPQKKLEEFVAIAMNEQARDLTKLRKFGEAEAQMQKLLTEFRRSNPDLAAKVLHNLAGIYARGGKVQKAVETYRRVAKEFKRTEVAPESMFTIGQIYESQTKFEDAAEIWEDLAGGEFKTTKWAPDALRNAGLLREALKDYAGAIRNYKKYVELFAKRKEVTDVPTVFFRIGVVHEIEGDALANRKAAHDHYVAFAQKFPASSDLVVEGYTRACLLSKKMDVVANRKAAVKECQLALSEFGKMPADKAAKSPARHYAAQAAYELAEYIWLDYVAIDLRAARTTAQLKAVLTKKAEMLQTSEKAYEAVLSYKSGGWSACAAWRLGMLYYEFKEALSKVEPPEALLAYPDQVDMYYAILEETMQPLEEKALVAFKEALNLAREKNVYNECSKECAMYMSKLSPEEFPIAKEDAVRAGWEKDTLMAANFVRTLRRGDETVNILKWVQKKFRKGEDLPGTAPEPSSDDDAPETDEGENDNP